MTILVGIVWPTNFTSVDTNLDGEGSFGKGCTSKQPPIHKPESSARDRSQTFYKQAQLSG
jgi:hypothetical protein